MKNTVSGYTKISECTRDGIRYGLFEDSVFGELVPFQVYNLDSGMKLYETRGTLECSLGSYLRQHACYERLVFSLTSEKEELSAQLEQHKAFLDDLRSAVQKCICTELCPGIMSPPDTDDPIDFF